MAQARGEKADVVLERVGIGQRAELLRAVAAPGEPRAIPLLVGHHAQRPAALLAPGVERRVDVDHVEGAIGQPREDVEVVAVDEQVLAERHPRRKVGGSDELHAHDVMDTPGCGRVSPWHAPRCMRVAGSRRWRSSRCSGRPSSSPSTAAAARRTAERPGPRRGRRRGHGQALHLRARPARGLRARRRARPQPRALRQEPGRRGGLGPAHRALAADRRPRRQAPRARRRHARGDHHARDRPAAPTRAPPTT